jgi:hypothetical protein
MFVDPVIQEIRQTWARISKECGDDVRRIAERLRKEQAQHPHRVVRLRERYTCQKAPSPPPAGNAAV